MIMNTLDRLAPLPALMQLLLSVIMLLLLMLPTCHTDVSPWADWWTYDGISGPDYWDFNDAWKICKTGKFQSPIDIKPNELLYDPSLSELNIQTKKISGNITNTGHGAYLLIEDEFVKILNVSMGPLQYNYRLYQVIVHFGVSENSGSEHTVDGQQFPAEIQVFAFNGDLYKNASQALNSPKGILVFAIFATFGFPDNEAFRLIADKVEDIQLRGQSYPVSGMPIDLLFPDTRHYITYEGSLTQPGCQESVTWVIFNKPIKILREQLSNFKRLKKGGELNSEGLLRQNFRPTKPLYNRAVRTNINFAIKSGVCDMHVKRFYGVNRPFS